MCFSGYGIVQYLLNKWWNMMNLLQAPWADKKPMIEKGLWEGKFLLRKKNILGISKWFSRCWTEHSSTINIHQLSVMNWVIPVCVHSCSFTRQKRDFIFCFCCSRGWKWEKSLLICQLRSSTCWLMTRHVWLFVCE